MRRTLWRACWGLAHLQDWLPQPAALLGSLQGCARSFHAPTSSQWTPKQPGPHTREPWGRRGLERPGRQAAKEARTCAEVWDRLKGIPPDQLHFIALSAALDRVVRISKGPGYLLTPEDVTALEQLLGAAQQRLGAFNSWALAAFIRCAAGFREQRLLSPAGLTAWQAAMEQPGVILQFNAQEVSNTLLSLGTLADSDPQLAAAVDGQVADGLLRHAVAVLGSAEHSSGQNVSNVLYGAALLGMQPTAAQVAALFRLVRRRVGDMGAQELVQAVLACQKLIDTGRRAMRAGEPPSPSQDPYCIYYPGDELMGKLLARACELGPRLGVREASQLVGGCGALGYLPDIQELLSVVVKKESSARSMEASTVLMGCARLGVDPGSTVTRACYEAVLRDGLNNPQAVANAAWALAVLEACDLDTWRALAAMYSQVSGTSEGLRMLHQAYLLVKLRHGSAACPPDLLQRSLAAHLNKQLQDSISSQFQRTLTAAVRQLAEGQRVEEEFAACDPDGEGQVAVDIALPSHRIAVEADGPFHYLRNGEAGQQRGETEARNRLLRGWGWHVIVVPWTVWNELCEQRLPKEQRVAGLRRYLEAHTDLGQRIIGVVWRS